jgi:hypothetical protein
VETITSYRNEGKKRVFFHLSVAAKKEISLEGGSTINTALFASTTHLFGATLHTSTILVVNLLLIQGLHHR